MVVPEFYKLHNITWHTSASFTIDTAGKMVHIYRFHDLFYEAQNELNRILEKMPLWNPGYIKGKPVNVGMWCQGNFGNPAEATRVTAENEVRYTKSKNQDKAILNMLDAMFGDVLSVCIAQDPTLKNGEVYLRFAIDSNSNLVYRQIKGDTAASAIALFALQHFVDDEKHNPWLYSADHYLDWRRSQRVMDSKDTFHFSALDTFEITSHLNVIKAPDETTVAEPFMSKKGNFKKSMGIVPAFRIEQPALVTPEYKMQQPAPAKIVKCEYRIEDFASHDLGRTVTWYDSTKRPVKRDISAYDCREVVYYNQSTGKSLEFQYVSTWGKRVLDSNGRLNPVPLHLDAIVEHGYNAAQDSLGTRTIFPKQQANYFNKLLDTIYYYNKNGFADSAHIFNGAEYYTLTFSYNKKKQLVEMRATTVDQSNYGTTYYKMFCNYTYNSHGDIKSIEQQTKSWGPRINGDTVKPKPEIKAWYDYDAQNRPVKYTFVYIKNKPLVNDTSEAVYTYSPGAIISRWTYRKDENIIEQHFNQYGYLISDVRYTVLYPGDKRTIIYDYDYY